MKPTNIIPGCFDNNRRNIYSFILVFAIIIGCLPVTSIEAIAQNTYRLSKAPHYKTVKKTAILPTSHILFAGVELHPDMKREFFYQGREAEFQPLLTEIETYIDSLNWISSYHDSTLYAKGAPFIYAGSTEGETAPPHAYMLRGEHDEYPPMILYFNKSSKQWTKNFKNSMAAANADFMIMVWVGFSEYPKTNKGFFKKKVVLGTDYEREIRFLSAIDKPVEVLQLTGVVINKKGQVAKAGAEVFLHEDTPFWAQALDLKKAINDKTVAGLLEHRREDLPGNPIAWKVAVYHLIQNLTGRPLDYKL